MELKHRATDRPCTRTSQWYYNTYVAYGNPAAVGIGVGCRITAAWSCAACSWALYIPLAASAVARPRVNATPRRAAADTGDITTNKRPETSSRVHQRSKYNIVYSKQ